MAPPDPKSPPLSVRKAVIRELSKGRDLAARLPGLLGRSPGEGGQAESRELAEEVVACFSRALSALSSGEPPVGRDPAAGDAAASSLCSDDGKSEASTGKRKARPAGDRRGGQRRRSSAYTRTVASKTVEDGHTWRKYGQKGIQSATHPRSYFRCTHKYDQGCQATRQVQRSEDDSSTYLITYGGHHTCTKVAKSGKPGAERDAGDWCLINFGAPNPVDGGAQAPPAAATPAAFVAPKEECDDDALSNLSRHDSSDFLMMPELAALGSPLLLSSDMGDTTSGLHSSCVSRSSLDMDLAVESFEFDAMFNLDHEEFGIKFP